MVKKSFIIFGASSEIALSFKQLCLKDGHTTLSITQNNNFDSLDSSIIKVKNYIDDFKAIKVKLQDYENIHIIFFNGALYENRPIQFPSEEQIKMTEYINYTIPLELTKKLNAQIPGIQKFIYISSMAAVKYRYKNYIYGQNKRKLEKSIQDLNLNSYLIMRFGKVLTKMSEGHKNPPFTLSNTKAAKLLIKKIKYQGLVYPNFGLFVISVLLTLTPKRVINKLNL